MADILADVALAMEQTDHYWPPQNAPEYAEHGALFRWRTLGHLRKFEWTIPDHDRQRLIAGVQRVAGPRTGPQAVEMLAGTAIDFGDGYLAGGVLAWSGRGGPLPARLGAAQGHAGARGQRRCRRCWRRG